MFQWMHPKKMTKVGLAMYYKHLAVIWLAVLVTGMLFPFLVDKGISPLAVYKLALHSCTVSMHTP